MSCECGIGKLCVKSATDFEPQGCYHIHTDYSENGSLSICIGFHAILGYNILHVFRKPGSFVLFLSFSEVIIINCVGPFWRYPNLC